MDVLQGGGQSQLPEELCTGCGEPLSNTYWELDLPGSDTPVLLCSDCNDAAEDTGIFA